MRADLIEVFKILRDFENVDPEKLFQVVRDDGRRGHSFKLFKRRYRLDVRRFKFANWVCKTVKSRTGWVMMCWGGVSECIQEEA